MNSSVQASLRKAVGFVGVTVCATMMFWTPPASAEMQGPWSKHPTIVSGAQNLTGDPSVAISPDDSATVIWTASDTGSIRGRIFAAVRPPGGTFGAPVVISGQSLDTLDPRLAVGPDGSATAVWTFREGPANVIQAATRPAGASSFGNPVTISTPGKSAQHPEVAVGPDGRATVAWMEIDQDGFWMAETATGTSHGGFSAPVSLSEAGPNIMEPMVSTGIDGTTSIIWRRFDPGVSAYRIQGTIRPPGGSFAAGVDISTGNTATSLDPDVAVGPGGDTTAVWRHYTGTNMEVQQSTAPSGGVFGPPEAVSMSGRNSSAPEVAIGDSGTTALSWSGQSDSPGDFNILVSVRPPAGSFGEPTNLTAGGFNLNEGTAVSPDGTITVLWQNIGGTSRMVAATRPAGGVFGPATYLSASLPGLVHRGDVAIGPTNQAIAVWDIEGSAPISSSSTQLPAPPPPPPPPSGKASLKILKITPKKPAAKRNRVLGIKVTGKNTGKAAARSTRLCLNLGKPVRKAFKPKGRTCFSFGSLAVEKSVTRIFRLRVKRKAKRGRCYRLNLALTAPGVATARGAVAVRVR